MPTLVERLRDWPAVESGDALAAGTVSGMVNEAADALAAAEKAAINMLGATYSKYPDYTLTVVRDEADELLTLLRKGKEK